MASEKTGERYQNLLRKGKNKKWQYGRERYKNLFEDEKWSLVEYRKNYYKMWRKNTG